MTAKNNQDKNDREQGNKNHLSEAANTMRTSPDPEERSKAAREMGHEGGTQSHKNTNTNSKDRE